MKRLNKVLLFLIAFLFLALPVHAKGIFTPVLTGTVTNANMTITLTAGSADIDFASATIPRNYQGHLLKVCDSMLKCAQGYVYTNGAGNVQNIVSAKGGTTRNWISDSGINTDDAAGYTYTLLKSNQSVVVASGSIAQANNRGDYTATNAFYWANGLDLSAYQDGNHFLVVYDSGGLGSGGFISATAPVGDGGGNELLGASIVTNGDMELDANWENAISPTVNERSNVQVYAGIYSRHFAGDADNDGIKQLNIPVTQYGLYKAQAFLYCVSGLVAFESNSAFFTSFTLPSNSAAWTEKIIYRVTSLSAVSLYAATAQAGVSEGYVDDISLKQVTDPPPTGVRIVSTKGGAGRAWTWKNASFNPNTAATYKIYYLGD